MSLLRKTIGGRAWERGQALALFAAGLAGFLGLVGLSVDVGQLVFTRTDLQKSVDAAAFAGAADLPDVSLATSAANTYVSANISGASADVEITTSAQTNDTIKVTASKYVGFTFLRVIGLDGSTVSASAKVRMQTVTGFVFDEVDVFPYTVWGGARTPEHTNSCPYNICVGSTQVFRSNHFGDASHAAGPDWDVNGNNFKGYFHAGGDIVQINPDEWQTFSKGGNAVGQQPIDALNAHAANGTPIVVPVIAEASCTGGCGEIKFKIVAWVALKITSVGNPSQDWTGEVVEWHSTPAGVTNGDHLPPNDFPVVRTQSLIE